MSENINQVKDILNIVDCKLDKFLELCERSISDKILDRCHINTIPKRLNSLIQEFLIEQYKLNEDGILECKKQISSVSDNRQTVQFENIGGLTYVSKSADEFLDKNMTTLVKYRRMRWRNEDTK